MKPRPQVDVEEGLKGTTSLEPRYFLPIDWSIAGVVGLSTNLETLVRCIAPNSAPRVESVGERPTVFLGGKGRWILEGGEIQVFAGAELIAAVGGVFERPDDQLIEVVCHLEIAPSEVVDEAANSNKVGTNTERRLVDVRGIDLEVVGDVFVVPTVRGYAPALLGRVQSGELVHVLVGSKSASEGLEAVRKERGSLEGAHINLKKTGEKGTDPIRVQRLNSS